MGFQSFQRQHEATGSYGLRKIAANFLNPRAVLKDRQIPVISRVVYGAQHFSADPTVANGVSSSVARRILDSCQPWTNKLRLRLFNWEGTIEVSDYDYWRSTPLIVINHGLAKSGVDIIYLGKLEYFTNLN